MSMHIIISLTALTLMRFIQLMLRVRKERKALDKTFETKSRQSSTSEPMKYNN
jgi:hypothetical protein